jgi:FdhD protein
MLKKGLTPQEFNDFSRFPEFHAASGKGFPFSTRSQAGVGTWHAPCEDQIVRVSDKIDPPSDQALAAIRVCRISASGQVIQADMLAVEEPLEVRLGCEVNGKRVHRAVSITMRTPGHDLELAVGFLFTEGVIIVRDQVAGVHACGGGNVARVDLHAGVAVDLARLERHFYTSSSCGVCGKASLEAVRVCPRNRLLEGRPVVDSTVIHRLPEALRRAQAVFERTGGLHAAALFDAQGNLLCLREDVGRHNALDKLIGAQFLADRLPLWESVLLVSGRASFELVQKAVVAGIPILAAVGAPSSLAVSLAREHGLTVLGFVRQDRFNIYTGAERVRQAAPIPASVADMRVALSVVSPKPRR